MKKTSISLFSLIVLMSGVQSEARAENSKHPFFAPHALPQSVQKAEESFLSGDYTHLANYIKDGLIEFNGNPEITQNLLALYDKAYETRKDYALAPDWKMPSEMIWMAVGSRRTNRLDQGAMRSAINISLTYQGSRSDPVDIEAIKIVRYPDQVILDVKPGAPNNTGVQNGYTEKPFQEPDGSRSVWAQSDSSNTLNTAGLYFLDYNFKGKAPQHVWFILTRLNSADETPVITTPTPNQSFASGSPLEFRWNDFKSSSYQSYEQRRLSVSIDQGDTNIKNDSLKEEGNAGMPVTYSVKGALAPGNYSYRLIFRERHHFGDLVIGRESATNTPFIIK